MEEETLGQVADKLANTVDEFNMFVAGAKWQAEKMYSEEEVFELLNKLRYDSYDYGMGKPEFTKWFENNRKIII
jgi:chorismate mutase